jgi:ribosome-associated protein
MPQTPPAAGTPGAASQGAAAAPGATTPQDIRLQNARRFAIESARLAANTRCQNVAVLDVSGISPVTDFLVLATGTSPRQMKTVCDEVEELAESQNSRAFSRVGDDSAAWTCIDFIDVVVHVFSAEARSYYDLDGLWGDAKPVEWRDPAQVETTTQPS